MKPDDDLDVMLYEVNKFIIKSNNSNEQLQIGYETLYGEAIYHSQAEWKTLIKEYEARKSKDKKEQK